jgi:hypothetical protein
MAMNGFNGIGWGEGGAVALLPLEIIRQSLMPWFIHPSSIHSFVNRTWPS